jgi:hypothetical protein
MTSYADLFWTKEAARLREHKRRLREEKETRLREKLEAQREKAETQAERATIAPLVTEFWARFMEAESLLVIYEADATFALTGKLDAFVAFLERFKEVRVSDWEPQSDGGELVLILGDVGEGIQRANAVRVRRDVDLFIDACRDLVGTQGRQKPWILHHGVLWNESLRAAPSEAIVPSDLVQYYYASGSSAGVDDSESD